MAAQILLGLAAFLGVLILARWLSRLSRLSRLYGDGHRPLFRTGSGLRRETALRGGGAEETVPPASLHPVFNENRCIGCGACISACPEGGVIDMVDFETRLVNPSRCLGHGACVAACPMDAITLMLGATAREPGFPALKPNFSTRIPGLYVAGELGGMGLIRNAIEQGRQALESIRRLPGLGEGDGLDVVIVGAGPAGLSASLAAAGHKLRYVTLEQNELGGALLHYPRRQVVLSAPAKLPLIGEVSFDGADKAALLERWRGIVRDSGVNIHCLERVASVSCQGNGFLVRSDKGEYVARAVLLAIGRGGSPQTLGVAGEDLAKVVYRLVNPEQYRSRRVLVVGGGDSAVETVIAIALENPATATLSYRGNRLFRCREDNRERLEQLELAGRVRVMLQSQVRRITETAVEIQFAAGSVELLNDDVIVCAGGIAPDELYRNLGLAMPPRTDTLWSGGRPR